MHSFQFNPIENKKKVRIANFNWYLEKRFYNRETIPFIRISPLAESPFTISILPRILELRKGLIILVA
jgi:hypothetical protein